MKTINLIIPVEIPDDGDELEILKYLMENYLSSSPFPAIVREDGKIVKTIEYKVLYEKWEFADQPQGA